MGVKVGRRGRSERHPGRQTGRTGRGTEREEEGSELPADGQWPVAPFSDHGPVKSSQGNGVLNDKFAAPGSNHRGRGAS